MDRSQSVVSHLTELRRRIIVSIVAAIVGVALGWTFVPNIYDFLMQEAMRQSHVAKLTQFGYSEVFMVQFRMGIWIGLIIASPVIIYQVIGFVTPALKPREKRLLYGLLPATLVLFCLGLLFSYKILVPATVTFFMDVARRSGADVIIRPSDYLDMVIQFSIPMGAVFEMPVLVWLLASMGFVTARAMRRLRKIAILVALVVGAVISPGTAVIDQVLMTAPMLLLYEVSIWVAAFVERRRQRDSVE